MTVRVLALASGVTTLESHRLGLSPLVTSAGVLNGRSGIYPAIGAATLATVSAMVCSITAFTAWVDGTSTSTQGGYSFCSDATVNITFDAGNASTDRIDRVIARVKDTVYDGSGGTTGEVAYWKGNTSTGAATALPAGSLLLYEVTVLAGTTAGGGGINFGTAVSDSRVYTTASGGVVPIGSVSKRNNIVSPYAGMTIFRTDNLWSEVYDGTKWRALDPIVAAVANLGAVTDPRNGQTAYVTGSGMPYVYNGTQWVPTLPSAAVVNTEQGTASTSYTDLATAGPAVTVTTGTSALVTISSSMRCSVADGVYAAFAISGATTVAASGTQCLVMIGTSIIQISSTFYVTGLTAGANTFTMKYKAAFSPTAYFGNRNIVVQPLP